MRTFQSTRLRRFGAGVGSAVLVLWLTGCAARERVTLVPGIQPDNVWVDLETASVSQEQDGVVVTVQGAMLPEPRGDRPHPAFWVTIENNRDDEVVVTPVQARLVDSFGDQHAPVSMQAGGGLGRDLGYALVDPEVHTYVALHFGWPYYPIYPYRGWFPHWRYGRIRYWHYDPFWALGVTPVWIMQIHPRPRPRRRSEDRLESREETVFRGARLTYVVVFPELERTVREMRLIVPEIQLLEEDEVVGTLDFEMVFDQMVDVGQP